MFPSVAAPMAIWRVILYFTACGSPADEFFVMDWSYGFML